MTRQPVAQQQTATTSPLSNGGILQRQCGKCGQHAIAGEECAACGKKNMGVQRKLTIGASHDPLELEADRVADQVMTASANLAVGSAPPRIQRFTGQTPGQAEMVAPASVDRVLLSPGRPLDPALQQDMGQRFGHDFSRVRVHTDGEAGRSAREVNANAYTVGHNIVFGEGQFAPETQRGQRLIAHELAHTVQQLPASRIEQKVKRFADHTLNRSPIEPASISQSGLILQREEKLLDADLTVVDPEEAERLSNQGIKLPQGNPDKWHLPLIKALEVDCDQIISKLDVTYYSDNDETAVMKILYRWAFEPNPPDRTNLPGSVYLQALFSQLQMKTRAGVNYYNRLFSRSEEYRRDLKALRNYRAPAFKDTTDLSDEGISFELADAPNAAEVSTSPAGLTPDYQRVFGWLRLHKSEIISSETTFKIDRRAIAGAIAWEALENVRNSWTPSSVGPGKIHIKTHRIAGENTVAKQTEEAGYLPKQSSDDRKKLLAQPAGAIQYIAAIMKAGADIAWDEKTIEISQNPPILTYFYQSKDLPAWRALIKTKQPGSILSPGDFSKNMGRWVQIHLPFLEEAVGKPAFTPMHSPNTTSPSPVTAPTQLMKQEAATGKEEKPFTGVPDLSPSKIPTTETAVEAQEPLSVVSPPTTTTTTPKLLPLPAPAVICPNTPALKSIPVTCVMSAITVGMVPPAKESPPPLPILSDTEFGGDAIIAEFAKKLADCRAGRTVQAEVNIRYKQAVEQAKKQSDTEAKADKEKAIADAVAAIKITLGESDKSKIDQAVTKARKEAAAKSDKEAPQKKAQAIADVGKPDLAIVQAELQIKYETDLAADFKLTMQRVLVEYGPIWQNTMLSNLAKGREQKKSELKRKPVAKKGEPSPSDRPIAEINAELELHLIQLRCVQQNRTANVFEDFKHGWMVGRREEVDFDTIDQGSLKPIGKEFKPPRAVPPTDLMQIPEELKSDKIMPGVATEVVGFLRELQKLDPNFKAGNYTGHGGGAWAGKGFSLDLYLAGKANSKDDRGFWQHQAAVDFLLNLDKAAKAAGAEWRVLYNDFNVAQEVNRTTGKKNVTFVGNVDSGGRVNWHGPDPLKLHFHLDIAPTIPLSIDKQ
jgi:hypothetical protein